jgi:hypothetical protein
MVDVLMEETKVQAEEKGHNVRLVSSVAPTVPTWAVYLTASGELSTERVMLLNVYEALYRDPQGRLERYVIAVPVVLEDGSLEEEEGYTSNFVGLSLDESPSPEDWATKIEAYEARHRASERRTEHSDQIDSIMTTR